MENKINIAELLKSCPKGMELDCTMYEKCTLIEVDNSNSYPIRLRIQDDLILRLSKYGANSQSELAKCVIFPKGKSTWEGFELPPCRFNDGDIISDSLGTCIFKKEGIKKGTVDYYCGVCGGTFSIKNKPEGHYGCIFRYRLATEEEKQRLFKVIEDNGYKWNAEKKCLEKLREPKFKVGDRIQFNSCSKYNPIYTIRSVEDDRYIFTNSTYIKFGDEDKFTLLKFDVNTLKPFESKVLVRIDTYDVWKPAIFGCIMEKWKYRFVTLGGGCWAQCIPYESNEHLIGTNNDCDDFYKTWKD